MYTMSSWPPMAWIAANRLWTTVSRYFERGAGRRTRRIPRYVVGVRGDVAIASVDCHRVAPLDQPCAELLGEGLEAAVVGRDAADAEDRDPHRHLVLHATSGGPMVQVGAAARQPGSRLIAGVW